MSSRFTLPHISLLKALVLALLLVGGSACGGSKGKWKQIDLKTVKELLPEMLTAEASFNQRGLEDSLRVVGFQAILSRYGYTLADWDSSLVWYGRHQIVEYQKLYEHAALVLESRQATLQVRVDSLDRIERRRSLWAAHDIDSVNLLRDSASRYLAGATSSAPSLSSPASAIRAVRSSASSSV